MRKLILQVMVMFLFVTSLHTTMYATPIAKADSLGIKSEAAIIVDADTGAIVYEKNIDEILGVASMSKMMTEYLVLEAIEKGTITWDQEVLINEFIHRLSAAPGLSNIGLTQGVTYTVKELYEAMAIHSGNAATAALAEVISGTETKFVELMNEKAAELNLGEYKFVNSSGLNNKSLMGDHPAGEKDEENVMSTRATALLAYRLINDFPEVLETAQVPRLKFRDGKEYPNFNWMLEGLIYEYKGVDGLKTGSTDYAGFGFTATAERAGQRFITVIMKADSMEQRFGETRKLLDYAFSNVSELEVIPENFVIEGQEELPVIKGKEKAVKISAKDPISLITAKSSEEDFNYKFTLDKEKLNENGELLAPVKKGEKIGTLTIEPVEESENIQFLTKTGEKTLVVDVLTTEAVEKANWFSLFFSGIGDFFANLWSKITNLF